MDRRFVAGFLYKEAQIEQEQSTSAPEPTEEQKTTVTCLSDCMYANNPEKTCMLNQVSLSMDPESGAFSCGQYAPLQEEENGEYAENQGEQ